MPSQASFATQTVLREVREAVSEARDSRPELTQDGTGGVYLIRSRSRRPSGGAVEIAEAAGPGGDCLHSPLPPMAVFKPSDEEAGSENNPRGLRGEEHVMREGFRPGGGAARELCAYRLDYRGFAGVPKTAIDQLLLRSRTGTRLCEQSGSIQQFVESQGDASEYRFDGSDFCVRASQRVALLDLRLFNCDRHEGNLLVRPSCNASAAAPLPTMRSSSEGSTPSSSSLPSESFRQGDKLDLVPIDHAFVLPHFGYFREAEFVWRYWLAADAPFADELVEYVAGLDLDADVEEARAAGVGEASCATLRACTMLLKAALPGRGKAEAAHAASTPKELARMLMREQIDAPSPFERLCSQALGVVDAGGDMALIDYVTAQRPDGEEFTPPSEFYVRFEALLVEMYGRPCVGHP